MMRGTTGMFFSAQLLCADGKSLSFEQHMSSTRSSGGLRCWAQTAVNLGIEKVTTSNGHSRTKISSCLTSRAGQLNEQAKVALASCMLNIMHHYRDRSHRMKEWQSSLRSGDGLLEDLTKIFLTQLPLMLQDPECSQANDLTIVIEALPGSAS